MFSIPLMWATPRLLGMFVNAAAVTVFNLGSDLTKLTKLTKPLRENRNSLVLVLTLFPVACKASQSLEASLFLSGGFLKGEKNII